MVKQRMTALDVRASVEEMRSALIDLRLLNVYDIDSTMFLFKFGHGDKKKTILVENGVRMHMTELVREKPKVPSQFTLKLRKHVRAWRLYSITQLQHDRTVDMCFGDPSSAGPCFHIIIELFSKGNVVLTDHEYTILMLLRTYKENDILVRVRETYPMTAPYATEEPDALKLNTTAVDRDTHATTGSSFETLEEQWNAIFSRSSDQETVKSILSAVCHFGPALADHILAISGVANRKKKDLTVSSSELFKLMQEGIMDACRVAHAPLNPGGYLIKDVSPSNKKTDATGLSAQLSVADSGERRITERYDDFCPVKLQHHLQDNLTLDYRPSFGKVCDEYFVVIEAERIVQHNEKNTATVLSKRAKFAREYEKGLCALQRELELNHLKGELLQANASRIDEAIDLINGALASGIQWDALKNLLKRRHAEGNPVAYMIHELFLERNSMTVLLETDLYDEDADNETEPMVVEVELNKTAHANAATYFGKSKANRSKWQKKLEATDKAAAGAARKSERTAAKLSVKKAIGLERQRGWWEKFTWFRTSAGDVVLQGKDIQTTEILIRRFMCLGDVMVHCDVEGALPCILRPMGAIVDSESVADAIERPSMAIASLEEAGGWCVSRSNAWVTKQIIGSWWVYASQITGGTAAGCYTVSGEKNHILPQPLSLGCGVLFFVRRTVAPAEEFSGLLPLSAADGGNSQDSTLYIPPDPMEALPALQSVEALQAARQSDNRVKQERAPLLPTSSAGHRSLHQQQRVHHSKRQKRNGNRNSRTEVTNDVASMALMGSEAVQDRITGFGSDEPQALTKHQQRKLKKIQSKYGEQDVEESCLGALLNGNRLSKVQLRQMQSEVAKKQQVLMKGEKTEQEGDGSEESDCGEQVDDAESDNNEGVDQVASPASVTSDARRQREKQQQEKARATTHSAEIMETAATHHTLLNQSFKHYTSRPNADDDVMHAVCVTAPYRVLAQYSCRVELGFGSQKRMQVAQAVLLSFQSDLPGVDVGGTSTRSTAVKAMSAEEVIEQLRGEIRTLRSKKT